MIRTGNTLSNWHIFRGNQEEAPVDDMPELLDDGSANCISQHMKQLATHQYKSIRSIDSNEGQGSGTDSIAGSIANMKRLRVPAPGALKISSRSRQPRIDSSGGINYKDQEYLSLSNSMNNHSIQVPKTGGFHKFRDNSSSFDHSGKAGSQRIGSATNLRMPSTMGPFSNTNSHRYGKESTFSSQFTKPNRTGYSPENTYLLDNNAQNKRHTPGQHANGFQNLNEIQATINSILAKKAPSNLNTLESKSPFNKNFLDPQSASNPPKKPKSDFLGKFYLWKETTKTLNDSSEIPPSARYNETIEEMGDIQDRETSNGPQSSNSRTSNIMKKLNVFREIGSGQMSTSAHRGQGNISKHTKITSRGFSKHSKFSKTNKYLNSSFDSEKEIMEKLELENKLLTKRNQAHSFTNHQSSTVSSPPLADTFYLSLLSTLSSLYSKTHSLHSSLQASAHSLEETSQKIKKALQENKQLEERARLLRYKKSRAQIEGERLREMERERGQRGSTENTGQTEEEIKMRVLGQVAMGYLEGTDQQGAVDRARQLEGVLHRMLMG